MREPTKTETAASATTTSAAASDADLVIAYLLYAVKDVRALSARSTQLLEGAIATLIEDTRDKALREAGGHSGPPSTGMLC